MDFYIEDSDNEVKMNHIITFINMSILESHYIRCNKLNLLSLQNSTLIDTNSIGLKSR